MGMRSCVQAVSEPEYAKAVARLTARLRVVERVRVVERSLTQALESFQSDGKFVGLFMP